MTGPTRAGHRRTGRYLYAVAAVVILSGLLFGYDQGVISGALDGIKHTFNLSTLLIEVITSWVTLGAMVGALIAGAVADRFGRRTTIVVASGTFIVGALLESLAPSTWVLVVGRLVLGAGVGIASVAAPLYASENAPSHLRGRMVSSYQLAITIGIFIAYFADYLLISSDRWRVMLGISAVPAVLLLFAILPMGDSPRWYVRQGRDEEAAKVLDRIDPEADTDAQLSSLREGVAADAGAAGWREIFARQWRGPLTIAVTLAILQQFTGINAIIYYADNIFAAAGFNSPETQSLATLWAIGAVNVLATFIAVAWVDRFGRKPLLLIGTTGMCLSLLAVGGAFVKLHRITASTTSHGSTTGAGIIALVGLVVFIASFACSLGPVVWTIINEVFPARARGRGVAIATAANWLAAWLVSQFFLSLVSLITEAGTFFLFAGFCVATFVYVRWFVPETKGRTLEAIEAMWSDPEDLHASISTWA